MTYTNQTWVDLPAQDTPINAVRLGHIEQGIFDAHGLAAVQSVAGKTGAVSLVPTDVGAAAASHTHTSGNITDTTTVGRALMTAVDGNAARALIGAGSPSVEDIPSGSTLTVLKDTVTGWPARPTARADVIVAWKGADPSPSIVSSGTGGMLNNVDYRLVTP